MNNKIEDLALQADFSLKDIHHKLVDFQNFAELIIQECIFEMTHESTLQPNKEVQDFAARVSERFKQHFGVG